LHALCEGEENGLWAITYGGQRTIYLADNGERLWLSAKPRTGEVAGGGAMDVALSFDASMAGLGSHQGVFSLHSNDPASPWIEIPVTFNVGADAVPPGIAAGEVILKGKAVGEVPLSVTVDGQAVPVDQDGLWQARILLSSSVQNVTVTVVDGQGRQTVKELRVSK
jgi:hypothetical protein